MKMYMCRIAAEEEMSHTEVKIYPSVKLLQMEHTCWEECGIIEVDIYIVREIVHGTYDD